MSIKTKVKIENVCVVGLGYVGLPTAILIASKNTHVNGYDTDINKIKMIQNQEIYISEPGLKSQMLKVLKNEYFSAHSKITKSNYYIIAVPTPLINKKPDISYVEKAIKAIIPYLDIGDALIIESTSPVGTTDKMKNYIYKKRPKLKNSIFIAYCPERVLPGNAMKEIINNDRVIGGVDQKSTNHIIKFYSNFIKGELVPANAKTAEMCKLVENAYRDNQIAFANELSIISDSAKINERELIKLANMHPRVNILEPGPGVGGHCIAVDPYFIISDFPQNTKLISTSRQVNIDKTNWCIDTIKKTINNFKVKNNRNPIISFLGLAYKPDIDDTRESPANYIAKEIKDIYGDFKMFFVDPNLKTHETFVITSLNNSLKTSDIIIILVNHKEFQYLKTKSNQILIDFVGIRK
jgi:UDP-N-acetyl-D-mannosaminuronic acid dehydrogenase